MSYRRLSLYCNYLVYEVICLEMWGFDVYFGGLLGVYEI